MIGEEDGTYRIENKKKKTDGEEDENEERSWVYTLTYGTKHGVFPL